MNPRRETEGGAPLDEEQIRADERARIEQRRTTATEEHTAMADQRNMDEPRANSSARDGANVPVDRDGDGRPLSRPPPIVTVRPAWSTASTTTGQSWWRPRIRSSWSIAMTVTRMRRSRSSVPVRSRLASC